MKPKKLKFPKKLKKFRFYPKFPKNPKIFHSRSNSLSFHPTPQISQKSKKIRNFPTPFSCLPHTSVNKKSPHISCEPSILFNSNSMVIKSDYQSLFLTVQFTNNFVNLMRNFNKVFCCISFRCHCCCSDSYTARLFRASTFIRNAILI